MKFDVPMKPNCTRSILRSSLTLAAVAAFSAFGAACSNEPDVSFDYIKHNLTPELMGLSERPVDIDRSLAVNQDQNLRMFWGDLGRASLFDQPSMMSPYYIISTNGQPR